MRYDFVRGDLIKFNLFDGKELVKIWSNDYAKSKKHGESFRWVDIHENDVGIFLGKAYILPPEPWEPIHPYDADRDGLEVFYYLFLVNNTLVDFMETEFLLAEPTLV